MADTSPFSALRQYLAEKEAHLAANPLERFAAEVCESYDPDACAHDEGYCVSSGDVYGNAWKELRALRESHDALFMALREQGFLVRVGAAVSKTTWACRVGCHKYDWCEVSPDGAPFGFYVYQCERCEKPGAPSKAQQAIFMNRMLIEYADAALAYLEALEVPNERP